LHIVLTVLATWFILALIFPGNKKKEKLSVETIEHYWFDYGTSIEIMGKTFVKQQHGYVYNGLVWGNHSFTGNYFGMLPAIELTKEEFFKYLETMS